MANVIHGITNATANTCNTQRAIQRGRRRGHCSKMPNTIMPVKPNASVRTTAAGTVDCQPLPMISPSTRDVISVKRMRRQPNSNASPRAGAAVTDMRAG